MRTHFMTRSAILLSVAAFAMASCSKKSPTAPSQSITLSSTASIDGWVTSAGVANADSGGPLVGDFDSVNNGVGIREFYSFSLNALPASATIESATLRLYQASVGGQPYTALGNVVVDSANIGVALDAGDYSLPAFASNIGTLSTNVTKEYKTLDVTTAVKADRTAARPASQFRLRFSNLDSNSNGSNDYVGFTAAEDSCCSVGQPPQLVVVYH